ncbi:serine hydrolase domain-containing protein [Bacillus sp. T33-2]|uniref:serine hydrolase domain-containing protein n=1 Tax=Bacillus sp. T33-2 TaxID=2054168 RepID=UPI000C785095|nr:serine hydrolase domain-containing protein [Bacillus sp. T33-2]PLR96860.1 serine hydrolase [Bacillus sp. T33-2]
MRKKKPYIPATVVALSSAIIFSTSAFANSTYSPISPTIEVQEKKTVAHSKQKAANKFTWNQPGPVSPVLHPGSAKGAGMRQEPLNQIDEVINEAIANKVMPGAVAFVARKGHIVKHASYGHAVKYKDDQFQEHEAPIEMQNDTIFDLASISKLFTTTAAMTLYDKGLFQLDDPVAKYIPEFAANGKEQVTIEQLMTHTSGFAAWIPLYTMGTSREERLQIVLNYRLNNKPGTVYTYSDLNMITLGLLIERLSGKRLDEYVKETITEPLGMKDTMYNPPEELKPRIAATEYQPAIKRGLVWGQIHDENAWSLDGVAGHAGVFSTASDLGKFAHIFLNEGKYGRVQILAPETVKLLMENRIPGFPGNDHGLGWELNKGWLMDALTEQSTLGHTGYTGTSIVVSPNNGTIAILLTNRVHPTRNTVSTNQTRRLFARQVADAIPVAMPGKKKQPALFAGYGDNVNHIIEADINLKGGTAKLSFLTWHMIEPKADYGYLEASADGTTWQKLASFTGESGGWTQHEFEIPENTQKLRFHYDTDGSVNGRGWYISDVEFKLSNGASISPKLSKEGWELRNY